LYRIQNISPLPKDFAIGDFGDVLLGLVFAATAISEGCSALLVKGKNSQYTVRLFAPPADQI